MSEPHDTLPVPAAWNESGRSWMITWNGHRSVMDTGAVRLDERDGEPVTLIGFSVGMWLAETIVVLAFGGVFTWLIVTYWEDVLAWGLFGIAWLLGVLVVVPAMTIKRLLKAIAGPGELALSSSGVRLRPAASWTFLPWSAARYVEAKLKRDSEGGWSRAIMIACDSRQSLRTGGLPRLFRRRTALRIDVDFIAINRVLLYHVVRFYHEHPQARDELGTLASIERIRSRDFL